LQLPDPAIRKPGEGPRGNAATSARQLPGLLASFLERKQAENIAGALNAGAPAARNPPRSTRPLHEPAGYRGSAEAAYGSADVAHRLLAGLMATAASLSANAAVLMLPGVALALLSAHLAGGRADLKHLP